MLPFPIPILSLVHGCWYRKYCMSTMHIISTKPLIEIMNIHGSVTSPAHICKVNEHPEIVNRQLQHLHCAIHRGTSLYLRIQAPEKESCHPGLRIGKIQGMRRTPSQVRPQFRRIRILQNHAEVGSIRPRSMTDLCFGDRTSLHTEASFSTSTNISIYTSSRFLHIYAIHKKSRSFDLSLN